MDTRRMQWVPEVCSLEIPRVTSDQIGHGAALVNGPNHARRRLSRCRWWYGGENRALAGSYKANGRGNSGHILVIQLQPGRHY